MGRKFLAARDDLVTYLSSIAKKRNITMYGLVNDALTQAIRAEEIGQSLQKIVDEHIILRMVKEAGFIVIMDALWNHVLEHTAAHSGEGLSKISRNSGEWFGKLCQSRTSSETGLREIENILKALLWNVSELSIKETPDGLSVRCIGSSLHQAETQVLADFMSGIIMVYDFKITRSNVARGIISLDFTRGARP